MGILNSIFGSSEQVTRTRPQVMEGLEPLVPELSKRALQGYTRPYQAYQNPRIAGFSGTQQGGMNAIRGVATDPSYRRGMGQAGEAIGSSMDDQNLQSMIQSLGRTIKPTQTRAGQTRAGQTSTNRWNQPGVADSYMSPYKANVIDQYLNREDKRTGERRAGLDAKLAGKRAFGSRGDLARTQFESDEEDRKAEAIAKLMDQGYESGASRFATDEDRDLRSSTGNVDRSLTSQTGNMERRLTSDTRNADRGMEAERLRTTGIGQGITGENTRLAGRRAAGNDLFSLSERYRTGNLDSARALMNVGNMEQQQGQKNLDLGYEDWNRQQRFPEEQAQGLSRIVYGAPTGSTTTTPGPSGASQLLGAGIGLAGLGGSGGFGWWADGGEVRLASGGDPDPSRMILTDKKGETARAQAEVDRLRSQHETSSNWEKWMGKASPAVDRRRTAGQLDRAIRRLLEVQDAQEYSPEKRANGGGIGLAGGGDPLSEISDFEALKALDPREAGHLRTAAPHVQKARINDMKRTIYLNRHKHGAPSGAPKFQRQPSYDDQSAEFMTPGTFGGAADPKVASLMDQAQSGGMPPTTLDLEAGDTTQPGRGPVTLPRIGPDTFGDTSGGEYAGIGGGYTGGGEEEGPPMPPPASGIGLGGPGSMPSLAMMENGRPPESPFALPLPTEKPQVPQAAGPAAAPGEAAADPYADILKKLLESQQPNKSMILARLGAGMAAGRQPGFLGNVGEGIAAASRGMEDDQSRKVRALGTAATIEERRQSGKERAANTKLTQERLKKGDEERAADRKAAFGLKEQQLATAQQRVEALIERQKDGSLNAQAKLDLSRQIAEAREAAATAKQALAQEKEDAAGFVTPKVVQEQVRKAVDNRYEALSKGFVGTQTPAKMAEWNREANAYGEEVRKGLEANLAPRYRTKDQAAPAPASSAPIPPIASQSGATPNAVAPGPRAAPAKGGAAPLAPANPKDRVVNKTYTSSSGALGEWTGTGWKLLNPVK